MFDILSILPGKKKTTSSGWTSFNAICCSHNGHKPDRRMRGGIKFDGQSKWTMNCFNCRYSCNFVLGKAITPKTRQLLIWSGVDSEQVQRWSLESLQNKDLLDFSGDSIIRKPVKFNEVALPSGSVHVDRRNSSHKMYVDYLLGRHINPEEHQFMITPTAVGRNSSRIIIPYTYKGKIVGNTSRYLDDKLPKYINDQQTGYVFGVDFQKSSWNVCIVVEGIFDSLSLKACALMHNTISNGQAQVIAQLNKQVIVVPDRDKAGLEICERALELGYSVSLPTWHSDIKDVNDAVKRYGKLPTLMSILQAATMSKIKIEIQRKKIEKNNRN